LQAGETAAGLRYLTSYTRRRLLGDHVPYPVEAWPEGDQRHLSSESGLYCRIFTEGLFGLKPTGLDRFRCTPRLPDGWPRMALRSVRAFNRNFDVVVDCHSVGD
jgi:cellobiose phosphorylase